MTKRNYSMKDGKLYVRRPRRTNEVPPDPIKLKTMTPEELLKSRYKVIADDTSGNLKVGEILILDDMDDANVFWCGKICFVEAELKKYTHLFRPLEWWEERKPEDMPEYVKLNPENTTGEKGIFKVFGSKKYPDGGILICHTHPPSEANPFEDYVHAKYLLPASPQEYLSYINSTTKQD